MRQMRWTAAVIAVVLPLPAYAHVTSPGLAGAYGALLHAITEPPAPVALIGLGLLLGLNGAEALKWAWPAFAVSMAGAMALMVTVRVFVDPQIPLLLLAVGCGLAAAASLRLPAVLAAAIGAAGGYFVGVLSAPAPASLATTLYSMTGALIGANLALVFCVAAIDMARQHWPQPWLVIGVRALGSWVAAIGAMLLALGLR
jgi:urease accessory protein